MRRTRLLSATLLTAGLALNAAPANAFFCIMMDALSNGGGGFRISGGLRTSPRFQNGPMSFAPGYPPPYPPPAIHWRQPISGFPAPPAWTPP